MSDDQNRFDPSSFAGPRSLVPPAALLAPQSAAQRVQIEACDDSLFFRSEDPTMTESGIYVPGNVERLKRHIVVAIGPGRLIDDGTRFMPQIKVGDRILLSPNARAPGVEINGETLYHCRTSDVVAILRPESE